MGFLNLTKKHTFNETIDNALLHLYLTVKEEKRFTPTTKRNEILRKYLKAISTNPATTYIKKDIKKLLIAARKSKNSLEQKLLSLKAKESEKSDLRQLFNLLNLIAKKHNLEALFLTKSEEDTVQENTLYMYKEQIEEGFNSKGELLKHLSILVEEKWHCKLLETISHNGHFEVKEEAKHPYSPKNKTIKCITIDIHR